MREQPVSIELVNQAVMAIGKGPRPEMLHDKSKKTEKSRKNTNFIVKCNGRKRRGRGELVGGVGQCCLI